MTAFNTPQKSPSIERLVSITGQVLIGMVLSLAMSPAAMAQDQPQPLVALPSLDVPAYMGTWYQVALFPNRFQKQCVSDTRATYRALPSGQVEVTNQCRTVDGSIDTVVGVARPTPNAAIREEQLQPAQLEVSFMPTFLRWLPFWGSYWVIELAEDGRYALVSEPSRKYLWVLSRSPALSSADETAIRSRLQILGFDLQRWQAHSQLQAQPSTPSTTP